MCQYSVELRWNDNVEGALLLGANEHTKIHLERRGTKNAFVLSASQCAHTPKCYEARMEYHNLAAPNEYEMSFTFHFVSHLPLVPSFRILCLFGQEEFFSLTSKWFCILICAADQFNVSSVRSFLVIVFWCIFFCVFCVVVVVAVRLACRPLANN